MDLLRDPIVLAPCSHVVCQKCAGESKKCPQCPKAIKERLGPCEMITDLVNKFEITKDALNTFKN